MIVPRITYPVPSLITFLSSAGMLANCGIGKPNNRELAES